MTPPILLNNNPQEANEWRIVLQLLAQLPHLSLQPDLICFNIAISCESPGAWRISLSCLSDLSQVISSVISGKFTQKWSQ